MSHLDDQLKNKSLKEAPWCPTLNLHPPKSGKILEFSGN